MGGENLPPYQADRLSHVDHVELCPECHTEQEAGFYRQDLPPTDPSFGKLVKCNHPFHNGPCQQRLAKISQLGPVDLNRRLDDIKPNDGNKAMLEAARYALDEGWGWFYFWGGPGNAKSEVLKAIVNECNEAGNGPATYTSLGRIIAYVKAAFHKDATSDAMERFDQVVNTRVLAIDEMDKVRDTEWLNEFRFQFLDHRYNSAHNKHTLTIFAGNPNPADIYDNVLYDRFSDGRWRIVENTADSARRYMRR